jgi:2-polyprenyl-6-hydroxyphenyl methylase/3-demethylubiquinone-9 3-methyltransferase
MWRAIRNAQKTVADDGYFYIALYSSDADFQPSKEFWIEKKREYNQAGAFKKRLMVWWYIWRFGMQKDIKRLPSIVKTIIGYRFKRGMNYFADVRDWLGGYPMEYAADQAVVDLLEGEYGFQLTNVKTGEACSEFMFRRGSGVHESTNVEAFIAGQAQRKGNGP